MLNDNTSDLAEKIVPVNCKLNFITNNAAEVPLRNHSMLQGAIFGLLAQVDPVYSYKLHKSSAVKPWSFSLLKFYEKPEKSDRNGYSLIKSGQHGYFFLKSIDPKIRRILMQFSTRDKLLHIGKLGVFIEKINLFLGDYKRIPADIDTISIRLDTPTFFYDNRTKKIENLSSEIFLKYQCEKFKQLGIMNIDPEQLYPYLWILNDNTKESWGYITNLLNKNEPLSFKGLVGEIKFKVVGNLSEKSIIWKILYLSEFSGIGTRTSMGFGHNTLNYFTSE